MALKHGPEVTAMLASWVDKKKYAYESFKSPKVGNCWANSILALPQPGKMRVCLNVSQGKNLNDNVIPNSLEKWQWPHLKDSDTQFGKQENIKKCWNLTRQMNTGMFPAKIHGLNKKGFFWGGRYLIETRLMFRAKSSVQNYDMLGNTER